MAVDLSNTSAWVITEGHAGIEVQAIALAEALGLGLRVEAGPPSLTAVVDTPGGRVEIT